jgi:hypothetical protein
MVAETYNSQTSWKAPQIREYFDSSPSMLTELLFEEVVEASEKLLYKTMQVQIQYEYSVNTKLLVQEHSQK